jgi:uncharacterized repeat protein (TIGR03943 family)
MRLSPARVVRALALVVWAGFFDWLWLSGEWVRFVGPRTSWVLPFGAAMLTLAAALYLAACVRPEPAPRELSLRDAAGLLALIAPVLALFVVPNASLGALALSRKSDQGVTRPPPSAARSEPLSLYDVAYASHDANFAARRGVKPGVRVAVTGLFTDPDRDTDPGFDLARFITTCCAADAVPYRVKIRPKGVKPPPYEAEGWYQVSGTIARGPGHAFEIQATAIRRAATPGNPYDRAG